MRIRKIEIIKENHNESLEEFEERVNKRISTYSEDYIVIDLFYNVNYTTVAYRECTLVIGYK